MLLPFQAYSANMQDLSHAYLTQNYEILLLVLMTDETTLQNDKTKKQSTKWKN